MGKVYSNAVLADLQFLWKGKLPLSSQSTVFPWLFCSLLAGDSCRVHSASTWPSTWSLHLGPETKVSKWEKKGWCGCTCQEKKLCYYPERGTTSKPSVASCTVNWAAKTPQTTSKIGHILNLTLYFGRVSGPWTLHRSSEGNCFS